MRWECAEAAAAKVMPGMAIALRQPVSGSAKSMILTRITWLPAACSLLVLCYSPALFEQGAFSSMAEHQSDYTPGSMDISQHRRGYAAFLTGVKWTLGFILLLMAFLAIFRIHN